MGLFIGKFIGKKVFDLERPFGKKLLICKEAEQWRSGFCAALSCRATQMLCWRGVFSRFLGHRSIFTPHEARGVRNLRQPIMVPAASCDSVGVGCVQMFLGTTMPEIPAISLEQDLQFLRRRIQ